MAENERDNLFNDELLNLAKSYLLKSCDLNYGNGCFNYAISLMIGAFNELNPTERADKKLIYQKLSKYLPTFIKYNQKACDLNSVNGCDEIGSIYWNGEGVKKDKKMAFIYFKKSCDLAQPYEEILEIARAKNSCDIVGQMYYDGEEITKNKQLALEYFNKACEIDSFQCGESAERFYKAQDDEFAFKFAKNGCEANDMKSCNYLGILYEEGRGTTKDLEKSFWTFYKLCHQKETYSLIGMQELGCYNLGLAYAQGKGVKQDYKAAFESFKKSCGNTDKDFLLKKESDEIILRSGFSKACAMVGEYYYNAQGIRQNYRKAMEYFGIACDMGEQSGCDNHKMMKQVPLRYGLKDEDFQ